MSDVQGSDVSLPRSIAWTTLGALLVAAATAGSLYMEVRTKNMVLTEDFLELKQTMGDLENRLEALERSESGQRAELQALARGLEQNRKVLESNQALLRELLRKSTD